MLDAKDYAHWLKAAARHSKRRSEAEDLLQEALIAALKARRCNLTESKNRSWLAGVIRKQAAMAARTQARRRARELGAYRDQSEHTPRDDHESLLALVQQQPKGCRIVATLALHGMSRAEIRYVLKVTDAALRQRIASIRRSLVNSVQAREIDPRLRTEMTVGQELQLGMLRRSLLRVVQAKPGIGTHDPDGHLIVFGHPSSHESGSGGNVLLKP